MSELHIPPFSGGTPGESKGGNNKGLRSTPTAGGRDSTLGRTGAISIVGGRGAKKAASRDEGKAASRPLSRSYFVPRSLEGYERHLRQIECEGYLQRRSRTSGTWRRRWFLLKDGHLSYFQDEEEAEVYRSEADARFHHHPSSQRQLSLGCVEAVRTEEKIGPLVFRVISSDRDDLVLQAESKEGMNDWLFGFHRALASIVARVMETGSWAVGQDAPLLRGVTTFQGFAGGGLPKVLGHGHGRARLLSLRQHRVSKKTVLDEAANRPGHRQGISWANGDRLKGCGVSAATPGSEGTGNAIVPDDDNDEDDASYQRYPGNSGCELPPRFAPSPPQARQGRSLSSCERRRRAESMGSWGMSKCGPSSPSSEGCFGFGGENNPCGEFSPRVAESTRSGGIGAHRYSTPRGFLASEEASGAGNGGAGGTLGGQGLLSRALSAKRQGPMAAAEILDDDEPIEQLDQACCGRGLLASNGGGKGQEQIGVMSATTVFAAMIYGSSDDKDRSSESGHGSTSEDDASMTSLGAKAVGVGLGIEVEAHSFLAAAAGDNKSTYVSPANGPAKKVGGLRGGGGGKYIPPALRAAAKSEASASSTKVAGAGKYVPPAMRAAARAEAVTNNASEAFCASPGRLTPPGATSLRNDKGHGSSGDTGTLPLFGGAGCGATCSALPRGRGFPWIPAIKEHYYTGQYHAHQPCSPSGPRSVPCSAKRGGTGGGPAPTKTPVAPSSGHHDGFRTAESSIDGFCESFAMDDDDEGEGVDPASETQELEAQGLWWSCGAWSIMGRREKQEDRFCAMPDYTKSIDDSYLFQDRRSSRLTATTKASPSQASFAASTLASSLSSSTKSDAGSTGEGAGANAGLAQGFFGVYDGHCGSEAVQFVRDRLHSMVCEHASFWKEPERAIREAFLSVDDDFLALAGEKEWYSGTTALVALVRGRKLLVGNLGDGEAVLCRRDQAVHMSPVHNPSRPDENQRIQEANGWVTTEQELFVRQLKQMDLDDPEIRMVATEQVKWNTITRVCGELAVSRSIGDRDFKGFTKRRLQTGVEGVAPQEAALFSWPKGHSGEFRDDLLTADPEFIETEIEEGDQFLLMACDGLWDVLGKPEAVERAKSMFAEGLCAQAVAERMCELAYRMGTSDNVTAVVVQFHHDRPY